MKSLIKKTAIPLIWIVAILGLSFILEKVEERIAEKNAVATKLNQQL